MTRKSVLRRTAGDLADLTRSGPISGFALCGGLALAVWGTPRATLDVDFLVDLKKGCDGRRLARDLEGRGWRIIRHAKDLADPVPEVLRCECLGVVVDLMIAHRAWERAAVEKAAVVGWEGVDLPSVQAEALAAMKLRAGGPQDLLDAERLEALPAFDRTAFLGWKKKLRIRT